MFQSKRQRTISTHDKLPHDPSLALRISNNSQTPSNKPESDHGQDGIDHDRCNIHGSYCANKCEGRHAGPYEKDIDHNDAPEERSFVRTVARVVRAKAEVPAGAHVGTVALFECAIFRYWARRQVLREGGWLRRRYVWFNRHTDRSFHRSLMRFVGVCSKTL